MLVTVSHVVAASFKSSVIALLLVTLNRPLVPLEPGSELFVHLPGNQFLMRVQFKIKFRFPEFQFILSYFIILVLPDSSCSTRGRPREKVGRKEWRPRGHEFLVHQWGTVRILFQREILCHERAFFGGNFPWVCLHVLLWRAGIAAHKKVAVSLVFYFWREMFTAQHPSFRREMPTSGLWSAVERLYLFERKSMLLAGSFIIFDLKCLPCSIYSVG